MIRSLRYKKHRDDAGLFVAEGRRCVRTLLAGGIVPRYIVVTPTFVSYHAFDWEQYGKLRHVVAEELFARMASLQEGDGLLMVGEKRPPAERALGREERVLLLDGIANPGNMGTIIRTAAWFGIKRLYASQDAVDSYNPKVVQASAGALAVVEVVPGDLVAVMKHMRGQDFPLIGAIVRGGQPLRSLPPRGALVIGNEGRGLRQEVAALLTHRVMIPSYGWGESLNVAVATGILTHGWCAPFAV